MRKMELKPDKKAGEIESLLKARYTQFKDGPGGLTRLAGENSNYLAKTRDGERFVLKLADEDTSSGMVEIEQKAVECLVDAGLGKELALPRIIPTREGKIEAILERTNKPDLRGRLLEFVDGTAWCDSLPAGQKQLEDLGRVVARINLAMAGLTHQEACRTHPWDLSRADQHRNSITVIDDPKRRAILEQTFLYYAAIAMPRLDTLPRAMIHADINDDNVLVMDKQGASREERGRGKKVCGLLDFGDCLENPVICDLAIAIAYHTLDEDDPLDSAAIITGAYHKISPLNHDELIVLFPLVCTRLAVSVIISAQRRAVDPDRTSWFVSEERAWKNLGLFSKIPPAEAALKLASKTDLTPYQYRGPSPDRVMEKRGKYLGPSISVSYDTPLKMISGKGQYLYDFHGRPFLDLYNNVCHVGHCHPEVVAAGQAQMARLNTNTRYLYDGLGEYAQNLCATLPHGLDTCFFVNSGSEANELALRMARTVSGNKDMLVVEGAYHGHTNAMIDISPYKFMGKGGKGEPEHWVHPVPLADGYRGPYKGQGQKTGKAYGDEVGRIIDKIDRPVAGFITEALLSCGGQVIPPKDYFKTAFAHVRKAKGLCIVDEVQTGFGRTGDCFWAFELQDVVPDILVMGKPMGNGHPISAVVTSKKIAGKFANGMEFFATFGGNPVSCAIGRAVLETIENEKLQDNAKQVGAFLLKGLKSIQADTPLMGDVRGVGLFIGIELVLDRNSLTPAPNKAKKLVNRLKNRGILLGTDGPHSNVIKIKPPMVINKEDAAMFLRIFEQEIKSEANK